jgi:uncharacterized protein (TIGR02145 family)
MNRFVLILFISSLAVSTYAQVGSITKVTVEQRDDGSGMVDIYFVLNGLPSSFYNIDLEVNFDKGLNFRSIPLRHLSGPLRVVQPSDELLHVKWDGLASFPETYSEEAQLKFIANMANTVTDIDGNVYRTVIIGEQEWMAENLRVTRNPAGQSISLACIDGNWENCMIYGGLYNWNVATGGVVVGTFDNPSNLQGICPDGWHIPSPAEWGQLFSYMENELGVPSSDIGISLKSCRQVSSPLGGGCDTDEHPRWNQHSSFSFDPFNFSALPGGFTFSNYNSSAKGQAAFFMTSGGDQVTMIVYRLINSNPSSLNFDADRFVSVRCVKD